MSAINSSGLKLEILAAENNRYKKREIIRNNISISKRIVNKILFIQVKKLGARILFFNYFILLNVRYKFKRIKVGNFGCRE